VHINTELGAAMYTQNRVYLLIETGVFNLSVLFLLYFSTEGLCLNLCKLLGNLSSYFPYASFAILGTAMASCLIRCELGPTVANVIAL
jgi:hypothetical protein